ncbi:hypothetical protein Poly30_53430 [Planctomycetes bacterium Poly30]|uniref:Sialate O-acetylesterase domain-containing protein n=1 Tax=Saltatorellus ferox TaxID=2528018 RepID=A0A518F0B9_9BACT|nr:hypothetical protein Poly30_53430 [Planctomycetes bacterium Poly30]
MNAIAIRLVAVCLLLLPWLTAPAFAHGTAKTLRVFVFAGQSNMVGADSKAADIQRFAPFRGLDEPQPDVRFHYCIGREDKNQSDGWVDLQPLRGDVGPELSFARKVAANIEDPIAIIKVAAGGTTLGEDWNPDEPGGFELYPLALARVREALAELDRKRIAYVVEGFMWHQGENDMFNDEFKAAYARNLANFIASWRRDLEVPDLHFYIGELCTKTVWGMDNRANMHAIEVAQRAVTDADALATYVPTSHVGVEIGGGTGLHYHYGTLGQLEHGMSHADAYLAVAGHAPSVARPLKKWPYRQGEKIQLYVLAGHRNMEGERAFVADLDSVRGAKKLARNDPSVAFRYDIGGGYRVSEGWEPLGPAGFSGTFGPELSFAAELKRSKAGSFAIAKFTHSGSQLLDWTPKGSEAPTRNLYPKFLAFVQESIQSLEERGHEVELAGILYHLGENDMAWSPFRREAARRLGELIAASRKDLGLPELRWIVSQQEPVAGESVDSIDVVSEIEKLAEADPFLVHVKTFDLPGRDEALVLTTPGIVDLGKALAKGAM